MRGKKEQGETFACGAARITKGTAARPRPLIVCLSNVVAVPSRTLASRSWRQSAWEDPPAVVSELSHRLPEKGKEAWSCEKNLSEPEVESEGGAHHVEMAFFLVAL